MATDIEAEMGRIRNKKIDVAINESPVVQKLLEGMGEETELELNGRTFTARTNAYIDRGSRKLFTLWDAMTKRMVAYLDVGLDPKTHRARCSDRSQRVPADETTLEQLRILNPFAEGFAMAEGEDEAGKLLMGLAIYTLALEGCDTLEAQKYIPSDDDDAHSDLGPQGDNFQTKQYYGVTPEIRDLVAEALKI